MWFVSCYKSTVNNQSLVRMQTKYHLIQGDLQIRCPQSFCHVPIESINQQNIPSIENISEHLRLGNTVLINIAKHLYM